MCTGEHLQRPKRSDGRFVHAYSLQQLQKQAQQPEEIKQIHISCVSTRLAESRISGHPPVRSLHRRCQGYVCSHINLPRCSLHLARCVKPVGQIFNTCQCSCDKKSVETRSGQRKRCLQTAVLFARLQNLHTFPSARAPAHDCM